MEQQHNDGWNVLYYACLCDKGEFGLNLKQVKHPCDDQKVCSEILA